MARVDYPGTGMTKPGTTQVGAGLPVAPPELEPGHFRSRRPRHVRGVPTGSRSLKLLRVRPDEGVLQRGERVHVGGPPGELLPLRRVALAPVGLRRQVKDVRV